LTSVIVDYNSGNLHSAKKSFQLLSTELNQGEVLVSSDIDVILKAERLILPGVGSFTDCKANLLKKNWSF
jgi:glutamine amidotransferase